MDSVFFILNEVATAVKAMDGYWKKRGGEVLLLVSPELYDFFLLHKFYRDAPYFDGVTFFGVEIKVNEKLTGLANGFRVVSKYHYENGLISDDD